MYIELVPKNTRSHSFFLTSTFFCHFDLGSQLFRPVIHRQQTDCRIERYRFLISILAVFKIWSKPLFLEICLASMGSPGLRNQLSLSQRSQNLPWPISRRYYTHVDLHMWVLQFKTKIYKLMFFRNVAKMFPHHILVDASKH